MAKHTAVNISAALIAGLVLLVSAAYLMAPEPEAIVISGDEAENGTVTGYGEYEKYDTVSLEARPNPGYRFVGWYCGTNPEMVCSSDKYTFPAVESSIIYAKFELDVYGVTATVEGGSLFVEGEGDYSPGEEVTLKATLPEGYVSMTWSFGGVETKETSITFKMPASDASATCKLEGVPCKVAAGPGSNVILVTGTGIHGYGSEITLTAVAADGYFISEWRSGSEIIGHNTSSLKYEVRGDAEITAYAEKYTGASFTMVQTGYTSPYTFYCTDMYSPYSSDSWSAKGYDADGKTYGLLCGYEETSPGEWSLTLQCPPNISDRDIVKMEFTHESDYGGGSVFTSSVTLDAYHWKYNLRDGSVSKSCESMILLRLSEKTYGSVKVYADLWNKLYRDHKDWDYMVTTDFAVAYIAKCIKEITEGHSDAERVQCALDFVNYAISYEDDLSNYGQKEYFATAYQTLYNRSGDCEDTSILFVTLAEYLGYDAYLISPFEHMAGGVVLGTSGGNFSKYPGLYYCETTGDERSWNIGEIPQKHLGGSCMIVDVSIF